DLRDLHSFPTRRSSDLPETAKVEVWKVACPLLRATPDFTALPSMMKSTVPAGVPEPGLTALMVAVNVTVCPNTDGLWSEDTARLVSALLTVWPPKSEPLLLL